MVHRCGLNPPATARLQPPPRLVGKGRDRDAVLKGDPAAANRFQAERRGELGGRLGADACRQKEPEDDVNQDEAGEPAGKAQRGELSRPTRKRSGRSGCQEIRRRQHRFPVFIKVTLGIPVPEFEFVLPGWIHRLTHGTDDEALDRHCAKLADNPSRFAR